MDNNLISNGVQMNHVELCELINKLRAEEGNRRELRTDHFLVKIRKEVETLKQLNLGAALNFWGGSYIDKQNQERPTFFMNRDGILQIVNNRIQSCYFLFILQHIMYFFKRIIYLSCYGRLYFVAHIYTQVNLCIA